jgi:Zn-dependent M28 family amino/carboxypeptidase
VLAGGIGPREATSSAYRRAAAYVEQHLRDLGYHVQRQAVPVPAGVSWGVAVPAGVSSNLIATSPGTDLSQPHVVVGAHLDTVPQAPGAEDNASGVAVLLELARLAAIKEAAQPVVLVAFAAEEPRGPGDDRHHYGSRRYVSALPDAHRQALRAMLSLDRVGVGARVPVCTGGRAGRALQRAVLAAAARIDVPTRSCVNRSSDHWSFEKARLPAIRLGSTPYAEYHSARDRPGVVRAAQLDRVGTLAWEWLSAA